VDESAGGAGTDEVFGEVIVVDTATGDVIERVALSEPESIAISPDGTRAYVVGRRSLFVMDTATNEVIAETALASATDLALAPDGSRLYAVEPLLDLVSVLDAGSLETEAVVAAPAGSRPSWIVLSPDGASGFVSLRNFQSVGVIDLSTNEIVDLIPVAVHPSRLSICPDGGLLYVVHEGLSFGGQLPTEPFDGPFGLVTVIDVESRSVVERISLEKVAADVATTPDSAFAYVTDAGGRVILIETATQRIVDIFNLSEEPIPLGGPIEIAMIPGGCEFPAACPGDCDRDGAVEVDDVIRSVNVALGKLPADACPAADVDGDGRVTVDELVAVVDRSLGGCG
jgi:YVTN family beta-propeller protein